MTSVESRMRPSFERLYHSDERKSFSYNPYSQRPEDLLLRPSLDNLEGRDMTLCALTQQTHLDQSNLNKLSPGSQLTNSIPSPENNMENQTSLKTPLETPEDLSQVGSNLSARKRTATPDVQSESSGQEMKRLRVENIVTSITPTARSPKIDTITESRNKRKAFRPQQHGAQDSSGEIDVLSDPEPEVKVNIKVEDQEKELLRNQLKIMGEQLQKMQQRFQEMYEKKEMERYELMSRVLPAIQHSQIDFESYVKSLSSEINQTIKAAVAEAVEKSLTSNSQSLNPKPSPIPNNSTINPVHNRDREHRFPHQPQRERDPSNNNSLLSSVAEHFKRSGPHLAQQMLANGMLPGPLPPTPQAPLGNPFLGGIPGLYNGQTLNPTQFNPQQASHMAAAIQQQLMENEMMDSYRGINGGGDNKKRRTKVTDTRLSPRAQSLSSQRAEPETALSLPTHHPSSLFPILHGVVPGFPFPPGFMGVPSLLNVEGRGTPPSGGSDGSDRGTLSPDLSAASMLPALPGQTVTLTPLHLRKAKLMFFYVRYPSSLLLKNFFCDVHFNKNNTAQLVKWFSNFREFYYIQMEKYARQALADGLSPTQITLTTDSELYKILNLHYNRNNQLTVPNSFLDAVLTTLREFVRAISCSKDREQSWKKPIYKIIARLDDQVPEYFKSQDWLEQLSD